MGTKLQTSASSERIKEIMIDVIDEAYKSEVRSDVLKKMKHFWFYFQGKELKANSDYQSDTRVIRIQNFSRPSNEIIISCLHETSHHLDFTLRNETSHDDEFCRIFVKMVQTAIKMKLISESDLLRLDEDHIYRKRIEKGGPPIFYWNIDPIPYKENIRWIKCRCTPDKRGYVQKAKFRYSSFEKVWIKEVRVEHLQIELDYLKRFFKEEQISIEEVGKIDFSVRYYISLKNGKIHKEALKKLGYQYEAFGLGRFTWNKMILAKEWKAEKEKIEDFKGIKSKISLA